MLPYLKRKFVELKLNDNRELRRQEFSVDRYTGGKHPNVDGC